MIRYMMVRVYKFRFIIWFILLPCFACTVLTPEIVDKDLSINILPAPKSVEPTHDALKFSASSRSYTSTQSILPLVELFNTELYKIHGLQLTTTDNESEADIKFVINDSLSAMSSAAYEISIDRSIMITAGSYQALSNAKATLLQLATIEEGVLMFPRLLLRDEADVDFRALMIDLARQWHELSTIKKLIDLAAFYKIQYVQLHFTDYQSYTLPSKHYPKLATSGRHYTFAELEELESYSQVRGVTIIPELEVPGHAGQFVKVHPEIFAIQDTAANPWIINMGKEEVYEAIDLLVKEIAQTFKASPYIHMGGDEAIFNKVMDDPDVLAYIKKHDIGEDVHELYRHFLVRMT